MIFVKLRRGSGKDRQGMALKAKGLKAKLKPEPRAYTKVGCHPLSEITKIWIVIQLKRNENRHVSRSTIKLFGVAAESALTEQICAPEQATHI